MGLRSKMCEWVSGVGDTPQTVTTTRAPAVLKSTSPQKCSKAHHGKGKGSEDYLQEYLARLGISWQDYLQEYFDVGNA